MEEVRHQFQHMALAASPPNLPKLPKELIEEEILTRVPFRSLIRFRSVNKSWCKLLSTDSNFIKKYLTRALGTDDDASRGYLLQITSHSDPLGDLYSLFNGAFDRPLKLDTSCLPFCQLVGSSNGLVCTKMLDGSKFGAKIYIWNPATGQFKTLPPPIVIPSVVGVTLGFCFDPTTDDYKVVRACPFFRSFPLHIEVDIYYLRTDSWKRLGVFPYAFFCTPQIAVMDGLILWEGRHGNATSATKSFILTFDVAEETFGEIPMLPNVSHPNDVQVVRGWISATVKLQDSKFEILYWGNKSWNTLIMVDAEEDIYSLIDISNNGDLLFRMQDGSLSYFKFETKDFQKIHIHQLGENSSWALYHYVESHAQLDAPH